MNPSERNTATELKDVAEMTQAVDRGGQHFEVSAKQVNTAQYLFQTRDTPATTIVVPGDLHLTERGQPNFAAALQVLQEINQLIRPDFVQFIGDNVQDAADDQFQLFHELSSSLEVPHFALVGDHDISGDHAATAFRRWRGACFGSLSMNGFRCVRLNTLDIPRLGFSEEQLEWLDAEFHSARDQQERVIVFQHHYPYKVCEEYDGPGVSRWREILAMSRPVAVFCGHTHYFQIANNGLYPAIAVRSIGDPEGGPPGYLVIHLRGNECACAYRTIQDTGPLILITHPRARLLANNFSHTVHDDTQINVSIWSRVPVARVNGQIGDRPCFELTPTSTVEWSAPLIGADLPKGEHRLQVDVTLLDGTRGRETLDFFVDHTRRYTAVPDTFPVVRTTAFC